MTLHGLVGWGEGVEELSKNEKGLMNMDNSVVIVGERGFKGTNW